MDVRNKAKQPRGAQTNNRTQLSETCFRHRWFWPLWDAFWGASRFPSPLHEAHVSMCVGGNLKQFQEKKKKQKQNTKQQQKKRVEVSKPLFLFFRTSDLFESIFIVQHGCSPPSLLRILSPPLPAPSPLHAMEDDLEPSSVRAHTHSLADFAPAKSPGCGFIHHLPV